MYMKRFWTALLAVAVVVSMVSLFAADNAEAKKKKANKPGAVVVDVVAVEATVDAIDYDKRIITLKGPEGNLRAFKVKKEIKNFDQIKAGDKIKAEYIESTAVFVSKSKTPAGADETVDVVTAPKGKKPAVLAVDTVEVSAKVEAIDYKKRTITLKGPEGNVSTFKVDKRVKRLKEIKKGDDIVLRHTEAVAITVVKP
jgi:hypothetical protein